MIIFLTSVTGTISGIFWHLFSKQFERVSAQLMYLSLRFVCLFYLVPMEYVCLLLTSSGNMFQSDGLVQTRFLMTEILWIIVACLLFLWAGVTVQSVAMHIWRNLNVRQIYKGNIPEDDAEAMEEFARICGKLRVRRKIGLCRNDMIYTPQLYGFFRPCVLLPYRKYTREQLTVIFHHELTHYKNHDIFFKWCALCIQLTQHLNPIAKKLRGRMDEWSEYNCDRKAVEAIGDEMSAGRYFQVIIETAGRAARIPEDDSVFSMLCESEIQLERRIEYMKRYQKMTRRTKVYGTALAVLFLLLNVTTTYAAGIKLSELHGKLYELAENAVREDTGEPMAVVEHYLPAEEDDCAEADIVYVPQEAGLYNLEENESVQFDWEIESGKRYVGGAFEVEAGQYIAVSTALNPTNVYCWMGIMDEANNVRYVDGYNRLGYDFQIVKSGKYRVFVHNRQKGSDVNAMGSYFYYTPQTDTEEPEE